MALTVKTVSLWRKEVSDTTGVLADVLTPLAEAGVNLRVVMGYSSPGGPGRATIEVFPVAGKKVMTAATAVGLSPSPIACVHVEGDDRAGLGAEMAQVVSEKGIDIPFMMAETVRRKFSAVFGFQNDGDAAIAAKAIKSAAKPAEAVNRTREISDGQPALSGSEIRFITPPAKEQPREGASGLPGS